MYTLTLCASRSQAMGNQEVVEVQKYYFGDLNGVKITAKIRTHFLMQLKLY